MTTAAQVIKIEIIPVEQIKIINPRARNKKTFRQIVDSIAKVGLKKPITVRRNKEQDESGQIYNLICGQGRLEAVTILGQREIPAIISGANELEGLVMSLVENLARRRHQPLELLNDIKELGNRGYTDKEIAAKIGLSRKYVQMMHLLLDNGEERLLAAVESGHIPVSVAIDIAETDKDGAQEALAQAYQLGQLRGKKLIVARRLVEQRQRRGKTFQSGRRSSSGSNRGLSSAQLVRAYEQEADRQRMMIKKSEITQSRLLFIVEAVRQLFADHNFMTLLRAEKLTTMPRPLADLIAKRESH